MFHFREVVEPVAAPRRSLLWRVAAWPLRVLAARRAMAALGAMSDRELADVGLYRQDLRDATALRLGEDPTALLTARTAERRGARWAAAVENPLAPRSGERVAAKPPGEGLR
ncbi:MAG TPA: DUF1127 domain-containing protein [Roseiarcus sp.]|nr:DUF1127 domain-containing protein [Roseiarcus sp.]